MKSRRTLTFEQARGWNARRRSCGRFFAAVLSAAVSSGILPAQGATPAAAQSAVELPVAFQVKNTNTSPASCSSGLADGATYTIRGHISGPPAALASGKAELITIYLFGYEAGEWNWDLKGVPGYDYASEVAKKGQVSLTLDELGYGASGHPANGNETCEGAEADITHQIIQKLRHGEYTLPESPTIEFSKVVLAGHDVGGQVAEVEAYSYKDIDGLILVSFADQGFTPYITETETHAAFQTCTESASGYAHLISDEEFRTVPFYKHRPARDRSDGRAPQHESMRDHPLGAGDAGPRPRARPADQSPRADRVRRKRPAGHVAARPEGRGRRLQRIVRQEHCLRLRSRALRHVLQNRPAVLQSPLRMVELEV